MSNWYDFLDTADQFFISYSISPSLIPVKLFEIGHTVELYLKAANTKMTGDIDAAIKFGHNIKAIWDECKKNDRFFMSSYEIRDTIFNSDFIKNNGGSLSPSDQSHYFENQEFYIIAKYLPDIKYLGAPLKSVKTNHHVWVILERNPYWISFIKELRSYLSYPISTRRDWIRFYLDENRITPNAAEYLEMLYK